MLKDGITLMHEHVIIDLSHEKGLDDCFFNDYESIVNEFKSLYNNGVRNIVDVTTDGMGRDPEYVNKVEVATGINIISSTGFYQDKFLPKFVDDNSVEAIADFFVSEITNGIGDSGRYANIIGEIGTSKNMMTDREQKVFEAAVIAHFKTGCKITTHCTLGTYGHEQVEFFKAHGVELSNVVIGHVDLTGDYDYIKWMLDQGVYVEFDTIGKNNYMPDATRVEILSKLQSDDLLDRVFFSLDITRKSNLKSNGGIGYGYLFEVFIPMLKDAGITDESLDKILRLNPLKFLGSKDE